MSHTTRNAAQQETPLERIPPELLRAIVEASSSPLLAYLQLLSLSHVVRTSIRGTLREISFDIESSDPILLALRPTITTDALAALVGPCKTLRDLSLPLSEGWCDTFDGAEDTAGWVDETFGGHTQLAILTHLPALPGPTIERVLSHLPGLVELTVGLFQMSTRLLGALARSCPGLQVLRCSADDRADPAQLAALTPLSGVLRQLEFWNVPKSVEHLAAFVGSLTAVTSLRLPRCPPAALEPLAPHLSSLELSGMMDEADLPGPWLCHLETLSLNLRTFSAPLTRLLAANQATLRSLTLVLKAADAPSLATSLRALPHLTHLQLSVDEADCSFSALLPPDLVDRLGSLIISIHTTEPVHIASGRLQHLRFYPGMNMDATSGLTLDCPALVELDMNGRLTALRCPRLRALRLPIQGLDGVAPMPDLEKIVQYPRWWGSRAPQTDPSILLAGSPRLRELSGVHLTEPDLLARLCACRSLVRLERLFLDVTRLPNPLVLRLPGQLEHLDLVIESSGETEITGQVQVLEFSLAVDQSLSSVRVRLHNCPHLPRSLSVEGEGGLDAACLLGLLTRHGARLHEIAVEVLRAASASEEWWQQLMETLSGLPLTRLSLDVFRAPSPLSLAYPRLRKLTLHSLPDEAKVVLACPLLEQLGGIGDPSRQLVLALPAPKLHRQ
ncbi:hypothetical protein PAPYR_565 [Paratrimastix pyriformis]|uniref:Uncharacterized protein n=1 Tax=Paratrimastix pyriformis TaxID=342808 RepID=A0ABQ8UTX4_9EUKA|nr:hypothetical protein PAPYR_565 [Paratrimastix pyriformis]